MHLHPSTYASLPPTAGFAGAFAKAVAMTVMCEFGDRTFFLAALLAARSSRLAVWLGVMLAVLVNTVLSALIGRLFPLLLTSSVTTLFAALLFLTFGLHNLRLWHTLRKAPTVVNEEFQQIDHQLSTTSLGVVSHVDKRASKSMKIKKDRMDYLCTSVSVALVLKTFSMTVAAEWGDRSQFAVAALAASQHFAPIVAGAVAGHAVVAAVAVVGGRMLSASIAERDVALGGAVMFLTLSVVMGVGLVQ